MRATDAAGAVAIDIDTRISIGVPPGYRGFSLEGRAICPFVGLFASQDRDGVGRSRPRAHGRPVFSSQNSSRIVETAQATHGQDHGTRLDVRHRRPLTSELDLGLNLWTTELLERSICARMH